MSEKRYWAFKHKPGTEAGEGDVIYFLEKAKELNCALMQYEYGLQDTASVTRNWNDVKELKEGDILFLRGDKYIHAVGEIVKVKPNNKPYITLNMGKIINNRDHGEYRSDKSDACIHFDDSDVFYEDLSDGKGEWGQRVDVDSWQYFNWDGIGATSDDLYEPGQGVYGVLRKLKKEKAEKILNELKEGY